jgi:hypothetical protein
MAEVVQLKRKPRPLRKTYQPSAPYEVERVDHDNGEIVYEVMDMRPDTYRRVCITGDDLGRNGYAKHDAEQIARGLNLLVQYGKESLPNVKDNDFSDLDLEDSDD